MKTKRLRKSQKMNQAILTACGLILLVCGVLFALAVPHVKSETAALIGCFMSGGLVLASVMAFLETKNV